MIASLWIVRSPGEIHHSREMSILYKRLGGGYRSHAKVELTGEIDYLVRSHPCPGYNTVFAEPHFGDECEHWPSIVRVTGG